jgi:hypothetical protein
MALEAAKAKLKSGEMMFANDLGEKGAKSFHPWMMSTVIDKLRSSRAPSLYEYLMTSDAQQFHVDIDYKNDRLGADALLAHTLEIVKQACMAVQTAAHSRGLGAGEPHLFNSSTATKGSFHLHYPSLLFANRAIFTEFGKLVVANAPDAVDKSVYSNGSRAWRTPYSAKKGKSNTNHCRFAVRNAGRSYCYSQRR